MDEQVKLFAMLQLYRANFQMLHWKACGRSFDRFHENVTTGYYEKLDKDVDDVAEILMRQGANPLGYYDVFVKMNSGDSKCKIVKSDKDYSGDDITKLTNLFLKDILDQISRCLNSSEIKDMRENIGIKSYYEALYNEYDKEYRFLNRRRGCENCQMTE